MARSFVGKFSTEAVKALPFDKIPGPKGFLGIGNIYNYFKFIGIDDKQKPFYFLSAILLSGKYSFDELHYNGMKKYLEFGPIVCERMIPGVNILWLYDPNDIAEMFRDEPGNFPRRQSHMALAKYRKDRPGIYRTGGLLPTQVKSS